MNTVHPEANILMAIPVRVTWDFKTSATYDIKIAISTPVTTAPKNPTQALPEAALKMTPNNAANNIIPSKPILITPALDVISAPIDANMMGVEIRSMG